jgi:hypothetical protein
MDHYYGTMANGQTYAGTLNVMSGATLIDHCTIGPIIHNVYWIRTNYLDGTAYIAPSTYIFDADAVINSKLFSIDSSNMNVWYEYGPYYGFIGNIIVFKRAVIITNNDVGDITTDSVISGSAPYNQNTRLSSLQYNILGNDTTATIKNVIMGNISCATAVLSLAQSRYTVTGSNLNIIHLQGASVDDVKCGKISIVRQLDTLHGVSGESASYQLLGPNTISATGISGVDITNCVHAGIDLLSMRSASTDREMTHTIKLCGFVVFGEITNSTISHVIFRQLDFAYNFSNQTINIILTGINGGAVVRNNKIGIIRAVTTSNEGGVYNINFTLNAIATNELGAEVINNEIFQMTTYMFDDAEHKALVYGIYTGQEALKIANNLVGLIETRSSKKAGNLQCGIYYRGNQCEVSDNTVHVRGQNGDSVGIMNSDATLGESTTPNTNNKVVAVSQSATGIGYKNVVNLQNSRLYTDWICTTKTFDNCFGDADKAYPADNTADGGNNDYAEFYLS